MPLIIKTLSCIVITGCEIVNSKINSQVSTIVASYMLRNDDELPTGSADIDIATLNSYIAENRVYGPKGIESSINGSTMYAILPNTYIKRETGSKLTGQFIASSGGDVYYISPTASGPAPIEDTSSPVIALTDSGNPDQMLATITYPADSTVREYKIDNGVWQTATIISGQHNSFIIRVSAASPGLVSEITVPYGSTITARAGYEDNTAKEATVDLFNPVTSFDLVTTPDYVTTTIKYPAEAAIKEYRIGTGAWTTYTEPVVVMENGILYARGKNSYGNIISFNKQNVSDIVVGAQQTIAAGGYHSLVIKEDGSLWAWGHNNVGQLGDGTTADKSTPVKIMEGVKQIASGGSSSFAIKEDGSLWAWGRNDLGQLGDGTTSNKLTPVKIMDGVTQVTASYMHTLAIKEGGSLWTWGYNGTGQLGDGTTVNKLTPIKIMDDVKQVEAGITYSLAIKEDGSLWAWGENYYGNLGDGTTISKLSPVKIMDGVAHVTAGDYHTLAIKEDGSLWTWGYNGYGQLGDGTTIDKSTPVKVMDGVKHVSAGVYHSSAIKEDGSLWTWGCNQYGQLGDGTTINKSTPVKIMEGVKQVTAGDNHSLTIKEDGSLWAWGRNDYRQLVDGTTANITVPVKIMVIHK